MAFPKPEESIETEGIRVSIDGKGSWRDKCVRGEVLYEFEVRESASQGI